ncbi:MAG: hypothetical protein A2086_16855 [Spirochaetes bacterium GWD1_27_9]|nr:MAG: hypothetical protein A2Z98_08185 [Spirochaetes bacterium GWB1_27_13]OHD20251.1 MAG: hypothetical protein A2Y34_04940 [Spirochaetes bacterium GWC1_27_15]OHD33458.1 MAG: hypothetical protein A2086_16855 [Spirochaetes bacterium GWD1_27_9]
MFEDWYLSELISKKIRDIWKLTDYYLLRLIHDILKKTEIDLFLKNPITINDIIEKKGYSQNVFSSLKWMFDRLVLDGYLQINDDKYSLTSKVMEYELDEIKNKSYKEAPDSIAAFNMLKLMADNYPDYLAGKKTGVDIIFSPENINITNEYYSNNLFYNVHNIAGAKILNYDMEGRNNPTVIEIGGGLGGGTKQFLLQRLAENKKIDNFKYYFTDIANKMLRNTRKDLLLITPNLSAFDFKKLDFNISLKEQDFPENSADIIWGVNAAHVAYDLKVSLTQLYKTLKPGGSLIISETVRPIGNTMIQQEFILNTLQDYWKVKLDDIRPRYGFMDWKFWINALEKIGFSKVETIPDMEKLEKIYDNCYVTIIRGIK